MTHTQARIVDILRENEELALEVGGGPGDPRRAPAPVSWTRWSSRCRGQPGSHSRVRTTRIDSSFRRCRRSGHARRWDRPGQSASLRSCDAAIGCWGRHSRISWRSASRPAFDAPRWRPRVGGPRARSGLATGRGGHPGFWLSRRSMPTTRPSSAWWSDLAEHKHHYRVVAAEARLRAALKEKELLLEGGRLSGSRAASGSSRAC